VRTPPSDLVDRCDADHGGCDAEHEVCFFNRHMRLYVAGWMLGGDEGSVRRALELYEGCGRALLDRPGRLSTAMIAAEVMRLLPPDPEGDGR